MADNYRQPGERLATTNGSGVDVASGGVIVAGNQVRVALVAIANGDTGECAVAGVYELAATSADAWDDGDLLYWDAATSMLTDTVAANPQIGFAVGDKAALDVLAEVLLASA